MRVPVCHAMLHKRRPAYSPDEQGGCSADHQPGVGSYAPTGLSATAAA